MQTEKKNIATIRIKTDLEKPLDIDLIAESIKAIADNFDKALHSGLTRRAICILIHDIIPNKDKVSVTDIGTVLTWAMNLRKHLTK